MQPVFWSPFRDRGFSLQRRCSACCFPSNCSSERNRLLNCVGPRFSCPRMGGAEIIRLERTSSFQNPAGCLEAPVAGSEPSALFALFSFQNVRLVNTAIRMKCRTVRVHHAAWQTLSPHELFMVWQHKHRVASLGQMVGAFRSFVAAQILCHCT